MIMDTFWEGLLDKPRIYVDLNSGGKIGDAYVIRLDSSATAADLQRYGVSLQQGQRLEFWTDDGDDEGQPDPLLFEGTVQFNEEFNQWVAVSDWAGFKHASELREAHAPQHSRT